MPRSTERFARQHRVGPPPPFREASTCLGIDQPASGLTPSTPGEHTPLLTPRGAASLLLSLWLPSFEVSLADGQNSLARSSTRTIGRRSILITGLLPFLAPSGCHRPVSGSFHPASAVLFNFPSRY